MGFTLHLKPFKFFTFRTIKHNHTKCVHFQSVLCGTDSSLWSACPTELFILLSHLNLLTFIFSEKCYETTHLRYYDTGESWGRIHLRNVEQCTCVAGEIKCERVHYTCKIRLLFCFNGVLFLLRGLLLLGWWEWNLIMGCLCAADMVQFPYLTPWNCSLSE